MADEENIKADTSLADALAEIARSLDCIRAVITNSVYALQHQNCEIDYDIALVLQRCASDPLGVAGEQLQELKESV